MDIEKLKALMGGDAEMTARFLGIFKNEIPKQLNALHEAIISKDSENVSTIAHGIKSQVKYVGLTNMAALAYDIEQNSEVNENWEKIINDFEALQTPLLAVVGEL